jgi:anthranilate phosphoribosyltransferase
MHTADILDKLRAGGGLTDAEVGEMADFLLSASAADEEKAALLRALAEKGESVSEIVAFVRVFLRHAVRPQVDLDSLGPAIDVCGTGGDRLDLFNVSTTSMFVLAAGGAVVAKHGNRGITSKSGGADVLEALGVRIDLGPAPFVEALEKAGCGFMFAPQFHPAFKAVAGVRKQLAAAGCRTIFNILGPLLNPVQPPYQLVGVADSRLPRKYAEILAGLGRRRAWVVHGSAGGGLGMDEVSTLGPTAISCAEAGRLTEHSVQPADFGAGAACLADLRGGDARENAAILSGILSGEIRGPRRDLVVANAAAGLLVAGLAGSWGEAAALAGALIDDGAALAALDRLRAVSNALPAA